MGLTLAGPANPELLKVPSVASLVVAAVVGMPLSDYGGLLLGSFEIGCFKNLLISILSVTTACKLNQRKKEN